MEEMVRHVLEMEKWKGKLSEKSYKLISGLISNIIAAGIAEGHTTEKIVEDALERLAVERNRVRSLCNAYALFAKMFADQEKDPTVVIPKDVEETGRKAHQVLKAQYDIRHKDATRGISAKNLAQITADAHMENLRYFYSQDFDVEAANRDPSYLQNLLKPHSDAFRAHIELYWADLDDSMKDALQGAYEEHALRNPNVRINAGYVNHMADHIIPSLNIRGVIDMFGQDMNDPNVSYEDTYKNMIENILASVKKGGDFFRQDDYPDIENLAQAIVDLWMGNVGLPLPVDAAADIGALTTEFHSLNQAMQDTGTAFASAQPGIQGVSDALTDVETRATDIASRQTANKAMMDLAMQTKGAGKELKNAGPELQAWAQNYAKSSGKAVNSMDDVIAALKEESGALAKETTAMEGELGGMLAYWYAVRDGIEPGINGELAADGTPLFNEADDAIRVLEALLKMLNIAGGEGNASETETRPKGGGRKKDPAEEARKAAEEARRAQEAAWQKALDDQLKFLDRKKRLGEIDTQEEIRRLELIAAKYAKTTQQKIAMEDKLFEARARLRDEEIGQIDKLNQGIITAIRSRYEEQRKIEEKRLQTSADSWREWADESVKAIQAQIDALDDLAKFEDREEQERKKLHKIEATKQMIEFTHDDANREQLERELKRLEEDFAKWQRNNAIADAKEQLRAEQDAIRERASQEQEGIAKQREELHELYDERLKEMALRAEAEHMLVKGNQEEILDLITSYAPEYDAAGKTLGQKLFEGLTGEFGSLTEWFDSLNADIGNIFDHMMERALSAADIHLVGTAQRESQQSNMAPPVNVEQNIHFHVPVESPSDVARRIQQVNEELGRQIMSGSY